MANIFKYEGIEYLNIDETVGEDGVNKPDDVYLVQAFLREVLSYRANTEFVSLSSFHRNPTGVFDDNTAAALIDYKRICNEKAKKYPASNNKIYYNKHIDPIRSSVFAFGTRKRWALARLNDEVREFTQKGGYQLIGKSYMFDAYPDMVFNFR